MMHVLLTNPVVQEAAVEVVPSDKSESSSSEFESESSESSSPSSPPEEEGRPPPPPSSSSPNGKGKDRGHQERGQQKRSFLRTCLVVVPKNVLMNWRDELRKVRLAAKTPQLSWAGIRWPGLPCAQYKEHPLRLSSYVCSKNQQVRDHCACAKILMGPALLLAGMCATICSICFSLSHQIPPVIFIGSPIRCLALL